MTLRGGEGACLYHNIIFLIRTTSLLIAYTNMVNTIDQRQTDEVLYIISPYADDGAAGKNLNGS